MCTSWNHEQQRSVDSALSLSLSQLDLQISFKHTYIARVDAWQLEIALVQQSFYIHNTQTLIKTPFYVVNITSQNAN